MTAVEKTIEKMQVRNDLIQRMNEIRETMQKAKAENNRRLELICLGKLVEIDMLIQSL